MRFYGRKSELSDLNNSYRLSAENSQMVVVTGRRRVGKTRLIQKFVEDKSVIYFVVSRKDEHLLCEEFVDIVQKQTNVKFFGKIEKFHDFFEFLLENFKDKNFVIVFDEIQEFKYINSSVYSEIQKLWDIYKDSASLQLIFSGSVYSMMKDIFENSKEPLFGRASLKINLNPFDIKTLQDIYLSNLDKLDKFDFFVFYAITGGVPKYVEYFVDRKIFSFDAIINEIFRENSFFAEEGKSTLIEEFGKEYTTYFSILSLIASSKTSRSEIESILEKDVGGFLQRLEKDFCIIKKIKPVFSKPNSRIQKYSIEDNFLSFWFRFIYKYNSAVEIGNYEYLKDVVRRDFNSYAGKILEKYFRAKLTMERSFNIIGNYWEKGNRNEIDIVGVNDYEKLILFAEVKMDSQKASLDELKEKSQKIIKKFNDYKVEYRIFSLDDMF